MPVNATQRKTISDLIKGVMDFEDETKTNFNFATVTVGGSATIDNIGIPVIWVNANSQFEVYVAQDIAAAISTGGSPLPDGSVIGLLVGDNFGVGFNKADVDLSEGDVERTILYRGDVTVVDDGYGITWGSAAAPAQAAFLAQLQEQRITTIDSATAVTPTYVS